MADFSKTSIWVAPVGNTLPTTGSTENLAVGQVGIFKDMARTAATSGNSSTATYLQVAQGRAAGDPRGSKFSARIKASKVKKYFKVTGSATAAVEIGQFSNFSARCGETLSLTLEGHSSYLDTLSYNGFVRSLVIQTPCCDCGESPCDTVDNEDIIDLFIQAAQNINNIQGGPANQETANINTFWVFEKIGTGDNAVLRVTAKPFTTSGKFCNISLNPYEYDRMWFRAWAYRQPESTVDFYVYDDCDQIATYTLLQRSTYPRGTSDQIYQMEIDYASYLEPQKFFYQNSAYNQNLDTYSVPGQIYDTYVIVFDDLVEGYPFNPLVHQDTTVIIAVPPAQASALEAVLSPYLGTVVNESGSSATTSTTTSTTTTSTTSTTSLIP